MSLRRMAGPIALLVVTGTVALGVQPAVAAQPAPRVAVSQVSDSAAREALTSLVTQDNLRDLARRAQAAGDTATVRALTEGRVALAGDGGIDIIGGLIAVGKVVIVAGLRYGGPVAAAIVELLPALIGFIPGAAPFVPLLETLAKPIADLIRVGAPKLADLLEQWWADPQRGEVLTRYLRDDAGLPADSATVFAGALTVLSA